MILSSLVCHALNLPLGLDAEKAWQGSSGPNSLAPESPLTTAVVSYISPLIIFDHSFVRGGSYVCENFDV